MGNDSSKYVGMIMLNHEYMRDCREGRVDPKRISEIYEMMPDKNYRYVGDFCNDWDTARKQYEKTM